MKTIMVLILVLNTLAGYCQKKNKITDTTAIRLLREIASYNIVEGTMVGPDGDSSYQFKKYLLLSNILTEQQFLSLALKNKNNVVRTYAYWYFLSKPGTSNKKIIRKVKHDRAEIKSVMGCMGRICRISAFLGY